MVAPVAPAACSRSPPLPKGGGSGSKQQQQQEQGRGSGSKEPGAIPVSAVPRGTSSLFDSPVLLRFERHDRWHEMSGCQRYAVSKAGMGPTFRVPFRYDAWRRGSDGSKIPQNLGCFDTAEEANEWAAEQVRRADQGMKDSDSSQWD